MFIKEDMVEEDGKYYPMMKVTPPMGRMGRMPETGETWDETELRYGRYLLRDRNPVLRQYLEREIRIKRQIAESLQGQDSPRTAERKRELEKEIEYAEKGMKYYAV